MRTIMLVCLVALAVAGGVAYAVGLVAVDTDHSDGKYVVRLIVDTAMLHHPSSVASNHETPIDNSLDISGRIAAVRPDKNEVVVSENVKNWTFQLVQDGKVFINDRPGKLAELQAGDEAAVTFDRQGEQMFASVIRSTRK